MRVSMMAACGMATLALAASAGAQTPPKTKKEIAEMYLPVLKDEGYKAEIDKDGDIKLRIEGKNYWINTDLQDTTYICMQTCFDIAATADRELLLPAAVSATRAFGVPKVALSDKHITYSVAAFVPKPEDMKVIFPKLVTNIQAVQTRFNETYAAEFNRRAEQKKLAAAKLAEAKKAGG
jgi:hypothetical protein